MCFSSGGGGFGCVGGGGDEVLQGGAGRAWGHCQAALDLIFSWEVGVTNCQVVPNLILVL